MRKRLMRAIAWLSVRECMRLDGIVGFSGDHLISVEFMRTPFICFFSPQKEAEDGSGPQYKRRNAEK